MIYVIVEGFGTREGEVVGSELFCGGRVNVLFWDFRCFRIFVRFIRKCLGRGGCFVVRFLG